MDIVGVFADAGDMAIRNKEKEHFFIATVFFFHAWPYIPATSLGLRRGPVKKSAGKKGRSEIPVP